MKTHIKCLLLAASACCSAVAIAQDRQDPPPRAPFQEEAHVVSPEILGDGRVTFRVRAPDAKRVTVTGDIGEGMTLPAATPAASAAAEPFAPPPPVAVLSRGSDGIWKGTTAGPVRPGAYRYVLDVDGVATVDQSNVRTSPTQTQVNSLLVVPGDFSEQRAVPHGALAEINYEPTAYRATAQRKLWVYTPPGYEQSADRLPVLYLLHGGGDTAESWATVGRANFIMDNLLAEKRAVPFIVVMMSGWTPQGPQAEMFDADKDPFNAEFVKDIVPLIERRYRVRADPANRALSGLSMGGFQTLTIGMKNIALFDYVMPMSTGYFTDADAARFAEINRAGIAHAARQLRLFRWGDGETDIASENGTRTISTLRSAGLKVETIRIPGGHEWTTWRRLLWDYAQRVFR